MVQIHCAYTAPLNPPGASPVLSREQVWQGLQRKIRRAQDFVPVITSTDVLEERDGGNEVVRVAHFRAGGPHGAAAKDVREVCKSFWPVKIDFHQPNGALITNTVSDGPSLAETDLHMTYTFEWRYPEVKEGSDEHRKLIQQHREGAKQAVDSSIEALRRLAEKGELGS